MTLRYTEKGGAVEEGTLFESVSRLISSVAVWRTTFGIKLGREATRYGQTEVRSCRKLRFCGTKRRKEPVIPASTAGLCGNVATCVTK